MVCSFWVAGDKTWKDLAPGTGHSKTASGLLCITELDSEWSNTCKALCKQHSELEQLNPSGHPCPAPQAHATEIHVQSVISQQHPAESASRRQ
jgi:hypothetical protein